MYYQVKVLAEGQSNQGKNVGIPTVLFHSTSIIPITLNKIWHLKIYDVIMLNLY